MNGSAAAEIDDGAIVIGVGSADRGRQVRVIAGTDRDGRDRQYSRAAERDRVVPIGLVVPSPQFTVGE